MIKIPLVLEKMCNTLFRFDRMCPVTVVCGSVLNLINLLVRTAGLAC
jgi:hypothetical protein